MSQITLKISNKIISWIFQYGHDFNFIKKNILHWALTNYEIVDAKPDFIIGVFVNQESFFDKINSYNCQKFLISGEAYSRHPVLNNCHSFVQDERPSDDLNYIRYAPTLNCWSPPFVKKREILESKDLNLVSVVDSGRYSWRNEMIQKASEKLNGKLDVFGGLGKSLPGHHHNANTEHLNNKYEGLCSHLFALGIENRFTNDYITEKVTDPIMCETIPICKSAPNMDLYFIEGSYVTYEDLDSLDRNNLKEEYMNRREAMLFQKEFLRTHLNIFSYFDKLTDNLSLLDSIRPITLN